MKKPEKRPTPEVAYMLGLIAAQKYTVGRAKMNLNQAASLVEMEERHLAGLENSLGQVKKDKSYASSAAKMPWLVQK
jgi:hypothetical protein